VRILYAALRHDPRDPDRASGVDHAFYSAFIRAGAEVRVVGPFPQRGWLIDRLLKRAYDDIAGRRYLKWNLQITYLSARALNAAEAEWKPDLVFGLFPPPLAFYSGSAPAVFNTDTTLEGWQEGGANFGKLPLRVLAWEEKRAVRNCALTITFSDYCKRELILRHGVDERKVFIQPMPSALPMGAVPSPGNWTPKTISSPLRLLLVGRDYERKGIPAAIDVVRELNRRGVAAELTICGLKGTSDDVVRFVGPFRKGVAQELSQYVDLYRGAHLLIHPATFEPAGIVPAEAAAFGVPTITNDVGGLATQVAHRESGVVLPGHSPPEAYVDAILELIRNPDEYRRLAFGARSRYEQLQNWDVAGKRVMRALEEVVSSVRN